MGRIHLEDMEFFAFHGHYPEEKKTGNRFVVNLEVEIDTIAAGKSDSLDDAANYQQMYELVKQEMEQVSDLLEHVSLRILDRLYLEFPSITSAKVKVSKMNPPMGGKMKCVSVTQCR